MFFEACGLRFRVVCSERTHRRVNGPWGSSFDSWWAVLELEKSQHDSCSIISIVEAAKSGCQDDLLHPGADRDGSARTRARHVAVMLAPPVYRPQAVGKNSPSA